MRRLIKDPLSVVLVLVTVVALAIAGIIGSELYGRHIANSVVADIVACEVGDQATVRFGVVPPFLWQHVNGHYTNISVETAGNQIREAKGMKVAIDIKDVDTTRTSTSAGTIGSLVANITWSADGIKQTVQDAIPLFGGIVSGVSTNAAAQTIELEGPLGSVVAKPVVADGGLSLQVQSVSGLGFTLPRESVQPALDAFTAQLTKGYPLGIKADGVVVTEDGVTSQFSTQNASMPLGDSAGSGSGSGSDNCFAKLPT
jgi:LmeA-like phospholipid-binding